MKTCTCCDKPKPFTDFYPRRASRDGRRGTCIECCLEQKRPSNRASYHRHKERTNRERRVKRAANLDEYRERELRNYYRYWVKIRERRKVHYQQNRERLITEAMARKRRIHSLDYGWSDSAQVAIWQRQQEREQALNDAREFLELLRRQLSTTEQAFLDAMLDADCDPVRAGELAGVGDGWNYLESVRRVASGLVGAVWA